MKDIDKSNLHEYSDEYLAHSYLREINQLVIDNLDKLPYKAQSQYFNILNRGYNTNDVISMFYEFHETDLIAMIVELGYSYTKNDILIIRELIKHHSEEGVFEASLGFSVEVDNKIKEFSLIDLIEHYFKKTDVTKSKRHNK